ncbi:MAG TPA: RES family NAD+ phosphorylase [Candidatus Dormibacteraeota bacterium]|nr:RES family NAD+ phosphorylase [Candidatus Dormibacteraeota bacterium]
MPSVRPREVTHLATDQLWWRIYSPGGAHPRLWNQFRHYGPIAKGRFDHHIGPASFQERAIIYAANSFRAAIAETFQEHRVIRLRDDPPYIVGFDFRRLVLVLDLCGPWPTRVGASQALATGDRRRSRRWSQAIYSSYAQVEGLVYPSSMLGGTTSIALYEHAIDAIGLVPLFNRSLADPRLRGSITTVAAQIGYRVV